MATNTKYQEARTLTCAVASGVVSGDVCAVGEMVGVAQTNRDSNGNAAVDFGGAYNLSVKGVDDAGNIAIAAGDPIFFVSGDTPKLSAKRTGLFVGYALAAVTSGSTSTIAVKLVTGVHPGNLNGGQPFVSTEQTGNGSAQNVAHGLGIIPKKVVIVPTDTAPATTGAYTATEGTHTTTNVVVTVTSGKKYKVLAWA